MQRRHHVSDILTRHTAQRPRQPAVICQDREITFEQLHRESNRTGNALRAAGVRRGARVAYLGRESEWFYEIVFGCAAAGAVLVPVNWRLTAGEIDHILRDSGTELVFVDPDLAPVVEKLQVELPALRTIVPLHADGYGQWKAAQQDTARTPDTGADDPFAQIYTSGTTGLPKGVVLAHRTFFTITELISTGRLDWIDWRAGETGLVGMPGFHIGGLCYALQTLDVGSTIVVMPVFVSQEAARLIAAHRINTMIVTPAMLHVMLAEPAASREAFVCLRTVIYGGSPISEALLTRCMEMMGCGFLQIYGSTETGNFVFGLPPADHVPGSPLLRSAGRPVPDVQVKVADAAGDPVPPGEMGEVCVRAPSTMLEYFNQPEATERALADGWLRMGDVGYLDENGFLFLCSRVADTIIVAGENIYPAETENALFEHPAVSDVAVIGVPDEQWGERVHACVVLQPGHEATPRDLMRFLQGRVADFKAPTGYTFMDVLPRNATGKILRRELREKVSGSTGAAVG